MCIQYFFFLSVALTGPRSVAMNIIVSWNSLFNKETYSSIPAANLLRNCKGHPAPLQYSLRINLLEKIQCIPALHSGRTCEFCPILCLLGNFSYPYTEGVHGLFQCRIFKSDGCNERYIDRVRLKHPHKTLQVNTLLYVFIQKNL